MMHISNDHINLLRSIEPESVDCLITDPLYPNDMYDIEIWKECLRVMKAGSFLFALCPSRSDIESEIIFRLKESGFKVNFTSIYWTYNDRISNKEHDHPNVNTILVAMKPLSEKTYVDQALKNGKGITWLNDGRIPYQSDKDRDGAIFGTQTDIRGNNYNTNMPSEGNIFNRNVLSSEIGRFPANLLVQDNVLDTGINHSVGHNPNIKTTGYGKFGGGSSERVDYKEDTYIDDSGDFSKYFSLDMWYSKNIEELPDYVEKIYPFLYKPEKNRDINLNHNDIIPIVKPIKLMAYLITIGSREGDTILDPFMGSGSTRVASKMLNRNFLGFEIERKYFQIIQHCGENNVKININEFEEDE